MNAAGIDIRCVVLAAGSGERFGGGPKQMARLNGTPVLEHVLRSLAAAPLARVIVVLGAEADRILQEIDFHGATPIVCDAWREGQSVSLRAGLRASEDAEAAVIALGDQPLLRPEAVERVVAARDPAAAAVRATYAGRPGHPVLLERPAMDRARELRGDLGARELLRTSRVVNVPCDGLGGDVDIDTVADLQTLERRHHVG